MLNDVDAKLYRINEVQLIKAAIFSKDVKVEKQVNSLCGNKFLWGAGGEECCHHERQF